MRSIQDLHHGNFKIVKGHKNEADVFCHKHVSLVLKGNNILLATRC